MPHTLALSLGTGLGFLLLLAVWLLSWLIGSLFFRDGHPPLAAYVGTYSIYIVILTSPIGGTCGIVALLSRKTIEKQRFLALVAITLNLLFMLLVGVILLKELASR